MSAAQSINAALVGVPFEMLMLILLAFQAMPSVWLMAATEVWTRLVSFRGIQLETFIRAAISSHII